MFLLGVYKSLKMLKTNKQTNKLYPNPDLLLQLTMVPKPDSQGKLKNYNVRETGHKLCFLGLSTTATLNIDTNAKPPRTTRGRRSSTTAVTANRLLRVTILNKALTDDLDQQTIHRLPHK